jgi:superfamily II DNA/RNA helicase
MSPEKFNLTVPEAILRVGYDKPTAIQLETAPIINSGADLYAVAPEGSGKTIAILMTIIRKLKMAHEKAPRALVLVTDKEKALAMEKLFRRFSEDTDLRSDCIYDSKDIQDQIDDLYEGTDVVFATPKRLHTIFLQNGVNINKLQMFIVDDASVIIKNGHKVVIHRLKDSLPRCQKLVFTEEMTDRLLEATEEMMPFAKVVEIEE